MCCCSFLYDNLFSVVYRLGENGAASAFQPSVSCTIGVMLLSVLYTFASCLSFQQHLSLKIRNTCLSFLLWDSATLSLSCTSIPGRKEYVAVMYPDHFSDERVMAEDPHAPKRQRRTSLHRFPWCYRICVLLILTLFGLHLLAAGSGAGSGESLSEQQYCIRPCRSCLLERYSLSRLVWELELPLVV